MRKRVEKHKEKKEIGGNKVFDNIKFCDRDDK